MASYNYTFKKDLGNAFIEAYNIGNDTFSSIKASIDYLLSRQMSLPDFYPLKGNLFNTGYHTTISGSNYQGTMFTSSATVYLKGLAKHYSIRLHTAYERQKPDKNPGKGYTYPSEILFFRGYESVFREKIIKLSVDYAMPLVYPDLGSGSVLYLKRIRTNLFADYSYGQDKNVKEYYFSYGIDILFDVNLFRFFSEIDLGARFVFNGKENFSTEIVFFQKFGFMPDKLQYL